MNQKSVVKGILLASFIIGFANSCKEEKKNGKAVEPEVLNKLEFTQRKVVDSAKFWWAHTPNDVTGDGIADILFINNNASGGYLGYYKGQKEEGLWELHIIAEKPITGGLFAAGDLEANDIDSDGDFDVIAVKHPGEWTDAGASAELFWYENENDEWIAHRIGTVPDAVKDVSFSDFDKDGKIDLSVLTFDEHTLSVFKQIGKDNWERVQFIETDFLHEGMGVGDLNADGFPDIVATGMIYYNPGAPISNAWKTENLDERWNNQDGDWSRNGTKTYLKDIDNDGNDEIFMAHSERSGYPLVMYDRNGENWTSTIIKDSIAACHTLQVYDFDLDGDNDILAGINFGRAINLNKSNFDVSIFLNEGANSTYQEMVIETEGIYNGQALDYDGDGDIDIFRYPNHESSDFYILENKLK